MEKEEKNKRVWRPPEADCFLQWGNRKRLRCVRVRNRRPLEIYSNPSSNGDGRFSRNITSAGKQSFLSLLQPPARLTRNSEAATLRSENGKSGSGSGSGSAEKEDRYYATRGSVENGDVRVGEVFGGGGDENRAGGGGIVWPKLYITLSSKEKEEDFMAIKGCKPPQRPKKKRAKIIQRSLLLVSPGAWLSDMCQERYEVREKKSFNKKKPRGLKAMDTDSE